MTTVNLSLLVQLLKHPPDTFHECGVQSLVVVVKVDPASHTFDGLSPFAGVSHDNSSALGVVLIDTHCQDIVLTLKLHADLAKYHYRVDSSVSYLNAEFLVDFVLNGQTVRVPTETTFNVVTSVVSVTRNNILIRIQSI